jgi:hypothetical protein
MFVIDKDGIEVFSSNINSSVGYFHNIVPSSVSTPNLYTMLNVGGLQSLNNVANFRFNDRSTGLGSPYNTSNHVGIGFWGNDDILTVQAVKRVGIKTINPAYDLDVTGTIRSTSSTTALSYVTTSDDRVKTNEIFVNDAMSSLNKLRPQVYDKYTSIDYASDSNVVPVHEAGLIAQEVFYDAPELRHLVSIPDTADSNVIYTTHIPSSSDPKNDPSDYSVWGSNVAGIRYEGFIPYIIRALQEKDAEIQELRQRMDAMKS